MPSATSWSAFGVIMSGLCQPTLCQPRSSTTTWCTAAVQRARGPERRSGAGARRRSVGAERRRAEADGSLTMTMCGLELKSGMVDAVAVPITARCARKSMLPV